MKNAKNAHYLQIDDHIKEISEKEGIVILPSPEAWEKLNWTKKYFSQKPEEGYFIWLKKQINLPIFTCISIASKNIRQKLQNLIILEKNLKISIQGTCNTLKARLSGIHKAQGKIILKENSSLKYEHIHSWDKEDYVQTEYEFFLEKKSKLDYNYKTLSPSGKLKIKTRANLLERAKANLKIVGDCNSTEAEIKESLILEGKESSGQIQLRIVGRENSKISAHSQILALSPARGHLDCQGLMASKNSKISLLPELICKNKDAQITHEASIGKISEDELNYLRMRGLNEQKAINLITSGFLKA